MDRSIDRRTFVQQSAAVTGLAVVASSAKSAPLGSNDRIRLGINEIPTEVPEPGSVALLLLGLTSLVFARKRATK